jgi:hypothetical protein
MRIASVLLLSAALWIGGCADETTTAGDPEADGTPTAASTTGATTDTEAEPTKPKKGAARWSADVIEPWAVSPRDVYQTSRDACSVFTPKQVAAEYDAAVATARGAASAFATTTYEQPFQAAARAGCLAGFRAG